MPTECRAWQQSWAEHEAQIRIQKRLVIRKTYWKHSPQQHVTGMKISGTIQTAHKGLSALETADIALDISPSSVSLPSLEWIFLRNCPCFCHCPHVLTKLTFAG